VAVAALLVVVTVFAAISVRHYFSVKEVVLPNVVGMPYSAAAASLRSAGLRVQAFVEDMPSAAVHAVTSQAPDGGTMVRENRVIHVGVNNPPAATPVPGMVGMSEAKALARAKELNLPVTAVVYQPNAKDAGTVIGQSPAPGVRLGSGRQVALTVSSGPKRGPLTVPDLKGMPYEKAVARLKAMGFTEVEALPGGLSFDKVGAVTSLDPKIGQTVPPGTPVAVFYALSGRTIVKVPKVDGMPLWRAQLALEAAQLSVGHVSYVQKSGAPPGVLKVEPSGYTLPGTPVELTFNGRPGLTTLPSPNATPPGAGPATPLPGNASTPSATTAPTGPRTVPFVFDPKSMGMKRLLTDRYRLKLVVRDADGERTVLDRDMQPGESVRTTVTVRGANPLLQTYIDGVFFQAWRP
jgi:beta-lactam-binding protein with PASTA domain